MLSPVVRFEAHRIVLVQSRRVEVGMSAMVEIGRPGAMLPYSQGLYSRQIVIDSSGQGVVTGLL